MKKTVSYFTLLLPAILIFSCTEKKADTPDMNKEFDTIYAEYERMVMPLMKETNLAYWESATVGTPESYEKTADTEIKLKIFLSDTTRFNAVKKIKESGEITDSLKLRMLNTLYNTLLEYQINPELMKEMVTLSNNIEQKFSTYRINLNGKIITDNDLEDILRNSVDNKELETAWTESKKLGPEVSADIIKLVKLRNKVAQSLGYENFHTMSLELSDQNPADVEKIFNELDSLVTPSFIKLKDEIDTYLSARHKISKDQLMPWHYQNRFFQEAPSIYSIDLDKYYKGKDLVALTRDYYKSIGMETQDIMDRSDLFEKPGKNQHAFCTHIDNSGDIRVLCNIKDNSYWMNTMLHELGHAVYDKYLDKDLPYILREPAHTFTTEAIAMVFGRMSSNAKWIKDMTGIEESEAQKILEESQKMLRLEQLVFSRWAQVMYRFEKSMYANPDQDLNELWWNLVEKYQLLKKPADRNMPDWATKIHIASSPCYYHNYQLGELFASQLHYYIITHFSDNSTSNPAYNSYFGNTQAGQFLKDKVFKPGSRYYWNDMIEKATGEKLTAKYYAEQFL
ncbi:MAG: peptidase M3 [Bacteroidetes bacterium HGW-Bacteroidetes-21]|nr:MAG: peptidase M3 [Bacteroidetes bacterium HGW-Bacteroidetes-21]